MLGPDPVDNSWERKGTNVYRVSTTCLSLMPGSSVGALSRILHYNPRERYCYGVHFTDEEMEAQRGQVTCSRSHGEWAAHAEFRSVLLQSQCSFHRAPSGIHSLRILLDSPVEITTCYTWVLTHSAQSSCTRKPGACEVLMRWKSFTLEGTDQARRNSQGCWVIPPYYLVIANLSRKQRLAKCGHMRGSAAEHR